MKTFQQTALIIGAGPAGLTAAYELLKKTDIKPIIIEAQNEIGGISATYNYKGNRIDIGGHRFYSKDENIVTWWKEILPLQGPSSTNALSVDLSLPFDPKGNDPEKVDDIMLIRPRMSRIFYNKLLFDYPLKPTFKTFFNLGLGLSFQIGLDYMLNRIHPIGNEQNLEDFFINRFGKKLYETFFKYYTEKVWGISCKDISKEWGSQRVKGISISRLLRHALSNKNKRSKHTETSLISQFLYPKFGPGQLWEEVARRIVNLGGEIYRNTYVKEIVLDQNRVKQILVSNENSTSSYNPDYLFSSMPIKDLMRIITPSVPGYLRTISDNLVYRDFIMTGILAKTMKQGNCCDTFPGVKLLPDTWIYIQDEKMISGRLQIYNNWSPYMVAKQDTAWIGLEFFCNEGDSFWNRSDADIINLASDELCKMNFLNKADILDGTCIRVKKAYPAYWGAYNQLHEIRNYLCGISNLYCIGRNGLHRYNNMDHSMLTSIASVNSLLDCSINKADIWEINSENEYGE